jgi:ATP-dependent Clp protease ATP-binding subunit ClpC
LKPYQPRTVHRYFELADSFLEVRELGGDGLELSSPKSLDRGSYRRLVLSTCLPDFDQDPGTRISSLFPEDPTLAEDLLYQLCVDVNPQLAIHKVSLTSANDGSTTTLQTQTDSYTGFLQRLRSRQRGLEGRLLRQVFGQDEAVSALTRSVNKASVGLATEGRPLGCFLFVGRTGTGKTELARTLGRELYRSDTHPGLIRIDCSEMGLAHEASKLTGAPPGYVGHESGGQLTEAIQAHPESVVLFDEVEKAHPKMHNLLLQILEEGALTDGRGQRVSFERALIILTSNAGAQDLQAAGRTVGFDRSNPLTRSSLSELTTQALRDSFTPEFLGRIDETVIFEDLDTRSARRIAQARLTDLAIRARRSGTIVAFTPSVARWVAERGFRPEHGARELRHIIQREIEPRLAALLLAEEPGTDRMVRVRVQAGELRLEIED